MAATSRRRSSHGLTSSGSSTQLARRGSSSRLGGARGRFDPSLMMSSNAATGSSSRDRSPHDDRNEADQGAALDKASRRNKSTDRLHRSRDSSAHLGNKRSKSFTHLGMTADDASAAQRRKAGSKKGKGQRPETGEDGWTSESADNAPSNHSAEVSPSSSLGDEGLVLGIKKRPKANLKQINTTSTLPEPKKEAFTQPDTPRASAQQLAPAEQINGTLERRVTETAPSSSSRAAASTSETGSGKHPEAPARLGREDTSKTLVNYSSEDVESSGAATSSSSHQQQAASQASSSVSALNQSMSSLQLQASPASEKPPSRTASALTLDPAGQTRHHRVSSNASNRTLRSSMPMASSPSSVRSRSSVLSSRFLLFPRETQAAAPPKLDTHNALAGRLGARHEDRGDMLAPLAGPSRSAGSSAMTSSTSAPVGLDQLQQGSLDARTNRNGVGKGATVSAGTPSPLSSAVRPSAAL